MPKLRYKCVFPNCVYETDDRSLIEFHHIHPKELGIKLSQHVTIPLCPTHHKLIYHPDATSGQHSIQHPESMSVVQVAMTNTGHCVIFKDSSGNEITVCIDDKNGNPGDIYCMSWSLIGGIKNELSDIDDDFILRNIDRLGIYQNGGKVYYTLSHQRTASETLSAYIGQYITKMTTEFASALDRAVSDRQRLQS